jgi:hypothetical protein
MYPKMVFPGSRIDFEMPVLAPMVVLSAILICPTIPALPAMIQCFPISEDPEIPTCAAITVCSPIFTLWAIWTKLSIFTPFLWWWTPWWHNQWWCWHRC